MGEVTYKVEVQEMRLIRGKFRGGESNVYRVAFTEDWGPPKEKVLANTMLVIGRDELDAYQNFMRLRGHG